MKISKECRLITVFGYILIFGSFALAQENGRAYGKSMQADLSSRVQQVIPETNLGPASFYPVDPSKRLYRMPYAAGKSFEMRDGYFSDPLGHPIWSDHPDYSLDFTMPDGEPILAARSGKVLKVHDKDTACGPGSPDGNYLEIGRLDTARDGKLVMTKDFYQHVRHGILVKVGDVVAQGQVIAFTSCTGCSPRHPHLHFEVNMEGHQGISAKTLGGDGRTFTSIPTPFVEIKRAGGYPVLGEFWTSENKAPDSSSK
jgi:murein DD-endopeptidase MepM/ murein hydrolase activator NlpD